MKEAWALHVAAATKHVKKEVLKAALAGSLVYNNAHIIDAVPCPDAVLEAQQGAEMTAYRGGPFGGVGAGEVRKTKTFGKLDPKSGLITSGYGLSFSEPCMDDIVLALKSEFPDSKVAFVKAAPASGGKDVLTVSWD